VFGNTARSVVARAAGRLDDALRYASRAVETADRERGEALHRHPRIWLGGALAALDRFAEAESAYATGRDEAERLGTAWSQPLWYFYNASLLTAKGWLDEAEAEAEAGVRIAEQLTALQLCVPLLGLLARIATVRGQADETRDRLRRMHRLLAHGITAAPEDVLWPIALSQYADGQPKAALRTLDEVYRGLPDRMLLLSNDPGCTADLVRIALDARAPDRAAAVAEAARRLAARNRAVPSLAGAAAHADGLLRDDVAALRTAVEHFDRSPRPLARIGALEDAAAAEHTAGHRDRAIGLLEAALTECRTVGAHRAATRIEQRLHALGAQEPVGKQADHQPGDQPIAGLTPAEAPVARLVAQGLTNRQIAKELGISPHTVDSHLRHIFTKLDVNSRVAVTRIVLGS
jgi:ATP/maltotriose-dependent transcriptional regulator MalT